MNKMDHVKIALSRLQVVNKMICGLGQFPITLIGMIAHGHGDERCAQYSTELWPNDPNFTIGSLLSFFLTLEKALACESKMLFEYLTQNVLFTCLLQNKYHCCRNPTLAKCGGEAQHLEKVGIRVVATLAFGLRLRQGG
jgi:hypothetical protein